MGAKREAKPQITIEIAHDDKAILDTFPVMRQLRPSLRRSTYAAMVRLQRREVRFQLAALRKDGKVLAVAGFRVCRSLGWGKFLYIDDLVTDATSRSEGCGATLLYWVIAFARRQHCSEVRLDSAVYRHEAHRFYLRERFDIACFNFRLPLTTTNDPKNLGISSGPRPNSSMGGLQRRKRKSPRR
jgi:GNAT superfamily N-acetyltransferase